MCCLVCQTLKRKDGDMCSLAIAVDLGCYLLILPSLDQHGIGGCCRSGLRPKHENNVNSGLFMMRLHILCLQNATIGLTMALSVNARKCCSYLCLHIAKHQLQLQRMLLRNKKSVIHWH